MKHDDPTVQLVAETLCGAILADPYTMTFSITPEYEPTPNGKIKGHTAQPWNRDVTVVFLPVLIRCDVSGTAKFKGIEKMEIATRLVEYANKILADVSKNIDGKR